MYIRSKNSFIHLNSHYDYFRKQIQIVGVVDVIFVHPCWVRCVTLRVESKSWLISFCNKKLAHLLALVQFHFIYLSTLSSISFNPSNVMNNQAKISK